MMFRRFIAVLRARNREFIRDRGALSWNILFPVFIVGGFAFAFSGGSIDMYKVAVLGEQPASDDGGFFSTDYIDFIPVADAKRSVTKVQRHQLDMLVDPGRQRYWINESSPKGYILERVLRGTAGQPYTRETVTGRAVRYVDWVVPGVLAMNMMFSALYGIGYVIVRYRKNGVLKRLKATPLTALEFLLAQIVSRLWLILAVTTLVYVGTDWFIDFNMQGSYLDLFVVFALGAISIISLGLVLAARTASEELAGGLVNLISWPMMFLSGVWFSLEGVHPLLQKASLAFPLTHLIHAARSIMMDGATLAEVSPQLSILALMTGAFLLLGSYAFRWE